MEIILRSGVNNHNTSPTTMMDCKVANPKYPKVYPQMIDVFLNPLISILSRVPRVLSCTSKMAQITKHKKWITKAAAGNINVWVETRGAFETTGIPGILGITGRVGT